MPTPAIATHALTKLYGGTPALAGRRDLLGATLPDHSTGRARLRLLGGPFGLCARAVRPTLVAWLCGTAAMALLLGAEAKAAAQALGDSAAARKALERLGGNANALTKEYLGVSFLILALMVALVAATQVSAMRNEELSGRIDNLLARPYGRRRWLLGRAAVGSIAVTTAGALAGLVAWAGEALDHAGVGAASVLLAGINVVPPALFLLGVGALVAGIRPRLSSIVVYALVGWSFLVEILASVVGSNGWVLDTSVFYQMSPAPAVPPDWTSAAVMVLAGAACAGAGALAMRHRDLATE